MKCSDVDRILPDLVDNVAIDDRQELEVQSHLKTCPDCSELVSDLKLIVRESRHLAGSEEPSPQVWARIAADLRAEGLIHESDVAAARLAPVPVRRRRWNPFWLAPVAAAVLAAGSYVLVQRSTQRSAQFSEVTGPLAQTQAQPQVAQQTASQQAPSQQSGTQPSTKQRLSPAPESARQVAAVKPPTRAPLASSQVDQAAADNASGEAALSQPTTVDDNQFLTEVSERAPTMRATYANQLQAVNSEIRETQAYITRYPGDVDARQHLLEVYQQKAMLYQMALDRIQ
jgi:Putative zinc-finger